jgi:Raf kinase inhibitor-like YbhB/YbcL family protein
MGMLRKAKSAVGRAIGGIHAGDAKLAVNDPRLACDAALNVESPAFAANGELPRRATADGEDVSPEIRWSDGPPGTREFVVLCEDPDAPIAKPFVHWLVHGIDPATHAIDDGASIAEEGKNGFHRIGYSGAAPPPGHGTHHYHFEVFALDRTLDVSEACTRDELVDAMAGHVLARGDLVGTYARA